MRACLPTHGSLLSNALHHIHETKQNITCWCSSFNIAANFTSQKVLLAMVRPNVPAHKTIKIIGIIIKVVGWLSRHISAASGSCLLFLAVSVGLPNSTSLLGGFLFLLFFISIYPNV